MDIFIAIGFICGAWKAECEFVVIPHEYEVGDCAVLVTEINVQYPESKMLCLTQKEVEGMRRKLKEGA